LIDKKRYVAVWCSVWIFVTVGTQVPYMLPAALVMTNNPPLGTCTPGSLPYMSPSAGAFCDLLIARVVYGALFGLLWAVVSLGIQLVVAPTCCRIKCHFRLSIAPELFAGCVVGAAECALFGLPLGFLLGLSTNFSLSECAMPIMSDANIWIASIGYIVAFLIACIIAAHFAAGRSSPMPHK